MTTEELKSLPTHILRSLLDNPAVKDDVKVAIKDVLEGVKKPVEAVEHKSAPSASVTTATLAAEPKPEAPKPEPVKEAPKPAEAPKTPEAK